MNFINENMYILISIGLLILLVIYLLNYYTRSYVDSEVSSLKKKIKKIQELIQIKNYEPSRKELGQMQAQTQAQARRVEFSQFIHNDEQDENDNNHEKSEIDADSYFDPTK